MVRCLGHVTFDFSMPTVRFQYRAVTRELPHNYPFIVQRGYIIDSVGQWDGPAEMLFDFTVEKRYCASSIPISLPTLMAV
jgi:hypothetical protein